MSENQLLIKYLPDPILLFEEWFQEASSKEINDPNAMNLSTISSDFKPSSRMVLLKDFGQGGFTFYTNTQSKKGTSITANPSVALNFHWKSLLRQIRIEGNAFQVSDTIADNYFNSRPEESRIGAWASDQSSKLQDREKLVSNVKYFQKKFKNKKIPRPKNWTGFTIEPHLIEFWKDMPYRLHDRLEYKKINNEWIARRLYP